MAQSTATTAAGVGRTLDANLGPQLRTQTSAQLADTFTNALNLTVKTGLDQQIAIQEYFYTRRALSNDYDHFFKGKLDFGVGKTKITVGMSKSEASSNETDPWVAKDPKKRLEHYQTTTTGFIQRKIYVDFNETDVATFVRDGVMFSNLLGAYRNSISETKDREEREMFRYVMGVAVDSILLPADVKTLLEPIKTMMAQNLIEVTTTSTAKSIITHLNTFMTDYYKNQSNKYNFGGKQGETNIFNGATDTGVPALWNTAQKEDTILVISNNFINQLKDELGATYNTEYWNNFTGNFGKVIVETFDDPTGKVRMYIHDRDILEHQNMFNQLNFSFYSENGFTRGIQRYRFRFGINPFQNGFAINYKYGTTA